MGIRSSGVATLSDERPATESDAKTLTADAGTDGRRPAKRRSDRDVRKLEPQIGRALRSVYDEAVGEDIPPDMLELLGKLS